jgi:hypothetical protein
LGCWLQFASLLPVVRAAEGDWPEGYIIAEKSESPNGRYGVLILNRTASDALDEDQIPNRIVDLKSHRRLCVIRGAHYFEGENHRGLTVKWAPDSSWCAVTYEERYGFGKITLIEIVGTKCTQTDLGGEIRRAMDAVIHKVSHGKDGGGYGSAYFRAGPGQTVLVRATSYTNPKSFPDQPTNNARFEGTFDLASHKWAHSSAFDLNDWDSLTAAYADEPEPAEGTDEDRLKGFDDRLNKVYNAVRAVLPAKRFAAVKKEQLEWLKQLDAQSSAAAKCKLMRTRIEELVKLLW